MINTTSVAFVLLGIGLAVCGWRFLRVFRKAEGITKDSKIGFLLSLYFIWFAIQTGVILGLGTLLLSRIPQGLSLVVLIAHSFLTLVAVFSVYMVCYIFFPTKSSWPAVILPLLLGTAAVVLTIIIPPQPFITPESVINWNEIFPLSILVFFLLFVSIGASLYTFIRLFFQAKTREIKILSFLLAVVPAIGVIDAFLDFVLLRGSTTNVGTLISDIGLGVGGLVLIFIPLLLAITKKTSYFTTTAMTGRNKKGEERKNSLK